MSAGDIVSSESGLMKRLGLLIVAAVSSVPLPLSSLEARAAGKLESVAADKKALSSFQPLVGEWKGVGQPRRGSSQGAWSEESSWAWHFTDEHAELAAKVDRSHYFSALRLTAGDKPDHFQLFGTPVEGKEEVRFDGARAADGQLVLTESGEPKPDQPARITIRTVAGGDRLVMLFERRSGEQYFRLAEVGLTRKGSFFAVKGGDPHECIVTGGHGTITADYKGTTYYFCCTGCRDAFLQDPEGILADYRARKAKEQAAAKP
jgi:YHS domain-containing protein